MFAARIGERLLLIHVADELGAELTLSTQPNAPAYNPARLQLRSAARRARDLGACVDEEFIPGNAAEVLTTIASRSFGTHFGAPRVGRTRDRGKE